MNHRITEIKADLTEMNKSEEDIEKEQTFRNLIRNFEGFPEENNRLGRIFTQEQRR